MSKLYHVVHYSGCLCQTFPAIICAGCCKCSRSQISLRRQSIQHLEHISRFLCLIVRLLLYHIRTFKSQIPQTRWCQISYQANMSNTNRIPTSSFHGWLIPQRNGYVRQNSVPTTTAGTPLLKGTNGLLIR